MAPSMGSCAVPRDVRSPCILLHAAVNLLSLHSSSSPIIRSHPSSTGGQSASASTTSLHGGAVAAQWSARSGTLNVSSTLRIHLKFLAAHHDFQNTPMLTEHHPKDDCPTTRLEGQCPKAGILRSLSQSDFPRPLSQRVRPVCCRRVRILLVDFRRE